MYERDHRERDDSWKIYAFAGAIVVIGVLLALKRASDWMNLDFATGSWSIIASISFFIAYPAWLYASTRNDWNIWFPISFRKSWPAALFILYAIWWFAFSYWSDHRGLPPVFERTSSDSLDFSNAFLEHREAALYAKWWFITLVSGAILSPYYWIVRSEY